jgi:hypothetical protein
MPHLKTLCPRNDFIVIQNIRNHEGDVTDEVSS